MPIIRALPALSLFVSALPSAHAHCGCNDTAVLCLCPTAGQEAKPGSVSAAVGVTVIDYERKIGPGTHPHGAEYDLRSYHTQLSLSYQAGERLRLQLNVPALVRETSGEGAPKTEDGLGDLSLFGIARLWKSESGRLDAFLGVEAPTGDTDGLDPGEHHDAGSAPAKPAHATAQEMTLGSGSWDVILGLGGQWATGPLAWGAEAAYRLNQEGDFDFEFGDELVWRVGPFLDLCPGAQLGVEASGVHRERDRRDGQSVDVSGSDWVFVGPSLRASTASGWMGVLAVDLPVDIQVNKQQMAPEWRGRLSVAKTF
jgi:hypothetical protein